MTTIAYFDLAEVKALVLAKSASLLSGRAIDEVIGVYATTSNAKGRKEAEDFIEAGLLGLTDGDFCERNWLSDWGLSGQVMDVYGKSIDGYSWYIKFYIEYEENEETDGKDGWLYNVSFHPPDRDMKLACGTTIKKGT